MSKSAAPIERMLAPMVVLSITQPAKFGHADEITR
jgi:hypothetical protein